MKVLFPVSDLRGIRISYHIYAQTSSYTRKFSNILLTAREMYELCELFFYSSQSAFFALCQSHAKAPHPARTS